MGGKVFDPRRILETLPDAPAASFDTYATKELGALTPAVWSPLDAHIERPSNARVWAYSP